MNDPLFHGDLVDSSRIIYTASPFARASLLHLQEIGQLQAQKPHVSHRDHLNSYLFFRVCSGTGHLTYGGTVYPLAAGHCVFIDCSQPYDHATSDDLWQLQWVHFNGPTASGIYEKYMERGGQPAFQTTKGAAYETVFQRLYGLAAGNDPIRDMRLNEGLSSLLTLLMEDSYHPESARSTPKRSTLLDIKAHLDDHFTQKITLDTLAEGFYINKFYLTRIFRQQFGISIQSYLLSLRITHAKRQLRFTDKSVEAIGLECGIGDLHYFSRVFKQVEGISPTAFRRQWRSR